LPRQVGPWTPRKPWNWPRLSTRPSVSPRFYRAVNDLVEQGWLKKVELPGEPMRYELADLEHHHHFHCTDCGRVFDVEGCALHHQPHVPDGFEVQSHEIILYGRCAECTGEGATT
jgi:Fe2+ or Zn2+ uptake regulation protein